MKMQCAVLAVSTLALSVLPPSARAEGESFKASFNFHAESAVVREGTLKRGIEPVMLTVVMEHTPEEVAAGRICGPWDVSDLKDHHELLEDKP